MVLTCTNCAARLQVDDAKAPSPPFSVRCPKCQASINVQSHDEGSAVPAAEQTENLADRAAFSASFEPPASAAPFKSRDDASDSATASDSTAVLGGLAKVLADALRHSSGDSTARLTRPLWDRRRALVCASPAYREAIAEALATHEYEVFVAENLAQGLGRMREERMDVIILDANFDPLDQGVAFITREVKLLRPSERRRLFLAYVISGVRTMDVHAAFLHNVNLVVNPSDIEQLPEALTVSIRHYNELYRPLNKALNVTPI